MQADRQRNIWR